MQRNKVYRWVVLYKDCNCPKYSQGFKDRAEAFRFSKTKKGSMVVDTDYAKK